MILEEWTVEKIVESFPITLESCKKLLFRSRWAPETLDALIRHDNKVIRNWKILAEKGESNEFGGKNYF